jgi:hypothetical protein
MDSAEATLATLTERGLVSATPNTASAPRDEGSPDVLYAPVLPIATQGTPLSGGGITASGVVEYGVALVTFAVPQAEFPLPSGTMVLDAKVYVTVSFDAGTTNAFIFSLGSSLIVGGGFKTTFANAYDVKNGGVQDGAAVTGFTRAAGGADVPQFLPCRLGDNAAVYVDYNHTGTAPTQGEAIVVLTLTLPIP